METCMLTAAGLEPISGGEIFGGETFTPLVVGLMVATYSATLTAVIANWDSFKDGLFDGYNSATH